jgi:integrase/recombinase XerD
MTFHEFVRQCLKQLQAWGYSDETIAVYDRVYMQFLTYVKRQGGHDDLRSFNDATVLGFAEDLGRLGIHPNTIIRGLSALSTLAKHGMMRHDVRGRRLVSEDPTKSFRWPVAQRKETHYLRPDELRALLTIEAPTHKALTRDLLVETGIRVGEASRLNVEDFQQADGRYYLAVKVKGRGQQRRQETRQIPLSPGLGNALRDWILARGTVHPDSALLVGRDRQRMSRSAIANMIGRLATAAGVSRLRVSPHKLRHTANVIARLANVDPPTRSRLLGHSSQRSLERYDHVLPHELHDAREQTSEGLRRYIGEPFRHEPETTDAARNVPTGNPVKDAE